MGIYKVQDDGWAPKGLAVGDLVVTGAGTYQIDGVRSDGSYSSHVYNKGQTTASYTGRYDDPNDKKTTQAFGKRLNRNLERIESNKNDTLNMLDSQKDELNKGYDTNAQHIYANYMMNNKNLNEQLIRAGLSDSGITESSQIASNAAYGANLTENETSRNMALKQIDDAKLQAERDAADAEAQAYSDYDNSILAFNQQKDAEWKQDKANNKVEMQTKLGNSIGTGYVPTDEELATAGWTREYYDSLNETAIYNNTSGDMKNQLAAVAGTGYVPTDEELAKAGWTREYWDSLNKAATPQVRTTSSGGGNPGKSQTPSYGQIRNAILSSSDPQATLDELDETYHFSRTAYNDYKKLIEDEWKPVAEIIRTYEEAVEYATRYGVPNSYASNIMTRSEWRRRKQNNPEGTEASYSSYEEYLVAMASYLVQEYGNW